MKWDFFGVWKKWFVMFFKYYLDIGNEVFDFNVFCVNVEFYFDDIFVFYYCNVVFVK